MSRSANVPDYDEMWNQVYGDREHRGPVHRHIRRILRGIVRSIEYDSVLDVGCGFGDNLPLLCDGRRVRRIAGIDISQQAIDHVSKNWRTDFHQLDIQDTRVDGRWDLVFSSLLLEHLPDDVAALDNMRAMTGRYLLVTTIAGDFERYKAWDEQMGHVRNYAVGELETKLMKAGFHLQQVIHWGFPFYSPLSRILQNSMKASSTSSVRTRLVADIMYYAYFLNSRKRGDLLVVLASV